MNASQKGPLLRGVASENLWFTLQETPTFKPWYKDSHVSHQQVVPVPLLEQIPDTEDRILITFGL